MSRLMSQDTRHQAWRVDLRLFADRQRDDLRYQTTRDAELPTDKRVRGY